MKEKMIQLFEGCGFSRAEAEKETAIHVREIQRRELPDRITEEQACNYFMMDLIFEQEIKAGETPPNFYLFIIATHRGRIKP